MAQWSCTVQFLAGKWATVKVPPTTPLLKVLEQAARKFGYNPADYVLKHGRVTLDLSVPVLYSNLPNRARLEALKKEGGDHLTSPAGSVLVALQLPDGQRVLHEHTSNTSLWDVLLKAFPRASDLPEDSLAVLYTRQRVEGRERLMGTSLLDLGLTQGKAALRLMIQLPASSAGPGAGTPGEVPPSTHAPLSIPEGVSNPLGQAEEEGVGSTSVEPQQKETFHDAERETQLVTEQDHSELMDTSGGSTTVGGGRSEQVEEGGHAGAGENEKVMIEGRKRGMLEPGRSGAVNELMEDKREAESHRMPATGGGRVSQQDRHCVIYHNSSIPESPKEDVPDEFYRVTIDDVLVMQRDLKAKVTSFDAPLETRTMRQLSDSAARAAEKYMKAVIRVQFPDGWVLQGVFEPSETLRSIVLFIRAHLADPALRFHLYTSPPKTVLRGAKHSLLQAGLVPATVVYVGLEDPSAVGPFLSKDSMRSVAMDTTGSIEEMRKVAGPVQTAEQTKPAAAPMATQHQPHVSMETTHGGNQLGEAGPSSSASGTQRDRGTAHTHTKLPKWLKLGPGAK